MSGNLEPKTKPVIKILFFGSIVDRLGKHECSLPVDAEMTLSDVLNAVSCAEFKPLLVAVNQRQVHDMNLPVKSGDEVAIMPPFSGG